MVRFSPHRLCRSPAAAVILATLGVCAARGAEDSAPTSFDEIETRDGRVYRGRVLRYDVSSRSYVLEALTDKREVSIPESDILTVRALTANTANPLSGTAAPAAAARNVAATLPPVSRLPDNKDFLARIIENFDALLAPRDKNVLANFNAGVQRVRSRKLHEALPYLIEALEKEPSCLAVGLFLGALYVGDTKHDHAYAALDRVRRFHPNDQLLLEMISHVCGRLGYVELERRYTEAWIRRSSTGAEALWRIFKFREERDPTGAKRAWETYLKQDPDLSRVDSPEADLFARGKAAFQKGDFEKELRDFALVARLNQFLAAYVRQYRLKALEKYVSEVSRGEPAYVQLSALEALAAAAPDKPSVADLRGSIERRWVERRLSRLKDLATFATAAEEIELWVKDARMRYSAEFATARAALGDGPGDEPLEPEPQSAVDRPLVARVPVEPRKPQATAGPDRPASIAAYLPLIKGSSWSYRLGDGTNDVLRLRSVDDHADYGSVYLFENEVEFDNSRFTSTKRAFQRESTLYMGHGSDPTQAESILIEPIEVGKKWSRRRGARDEVICEREYIDLAARVSCRAGTFEDCLQVRSTCWYEKSGRKSKPVTHNYYYARGVGLVKIEGDNPLDDRELENFSIGSIGREAVERGDGLAD